MNWKKFVTASIIVFAVMMVLEWVTHNVLLKDWYEQTVSLWRPMDEMQKMMPIWWVANLFISFLFVFIFIKGYENKGWMEGFRYGIIIGLFMWIPGALSQYVFLPFPWQLATWWFVAGMVEFVLLGIITWIVYKEKTTTA
jgi:hypothetical protein